MPTSPIHRGACAGRSGVAGRDSQGRQPGQHGARLGGRQMVDDPAPLAGGSRGARHPHDARALAPGAGPARAARLGGGEQSSRYPRRALLAATGMAGAGGSTRRGGRETGAGDYRRRAFSRAAARHFPRSRGGGKRDGNARRPRGIHRGETLRRAGSGEVCDRARTERCAEERDLCSLLRLRERAGLRAFARCHRRAVARASRSKNGSGGDSAPALQDQTAGRIFAAPPKSGRANTTARAWPRRKTSGKRHGAPWRQIIGRGWSMAPF